MSSKEKEFLKLIKENNTAINKIASMYTNNVEDKKDLTQEITLQLWKSFDTFSNRAKFSTWMYRIGLNTAFHFLKTSKTYSPVDKLSKPIISNEESQGEESEMFNRMKSAINSLKAMDKTLVLLYLENKTHHEISEITGLSISNVGTKISRIKIKLKKIIKKNN